MSNKKFNKLPTELSVEDLVAATSQDGPEQVLESKNDVIPFLTHFQLKQGAYCVNKRVIYDLYRRWSKEPLTNISFNIEANKYLFSRQIGKNEYFLINEDSFKLERRSFQLISKKRDKRKSPRFVQHFNNFLTECSISEGSTYIPSYGLHKVYKDWCKRIGKKPRLSYNILFQFFDLQFKSKRVHTSKGKAFAVSENIKELISEEDIKSIQEARKRKSKIKNKERSPKTPS